MIRRLTLLSIGLTTLTLLLGYALSGGWVMALSATVVGVFWGFGQWRSLNWVPSIGLVLSVATAALGVWARVGVGWMLVGVVAALSAWDLDHFDRRLEAGERRGRAWELERTHLLRLLLVDGLGLLFGAAALLVRVSLAFGWIVLLGALTVFGLHRAIRSSRREIS